jgi:hypothetical protein
MKCLKKLFCICKMNRKPVLVVMTSEACGHCANFKRNVLPYLERDLREDGRVKLITIDLPQLTSKPSREEYHPELRNYLGWFPTMSLFTPDTWYDRRSKLKGVLKDGKLIQMHGTVKPVMGTPNISKNSIMEWVDKTLKEHPYFGNNPSNPNHNNNDMIIVPTHSSAKFQPGRVK